MIEGRMGYNVMILHSINSIVTGLMYNDRGIDIINIII